MTDPEPGVAIEAPLSPAEDESETTRRGLRHRQREAMPRVDGEGEYAPVRFTARCVDRTGFRRRRHEWLHQSPRGTRCIWCGRLRRWEPL